MWFVDRAQILVKAGDGGRGCSAFAQPPYTRTPYPDGGNGGDGGDVLVEADPNVATLLDFQFRHEFKAGRGRHGSGNNRTGACGEDALIRVPLGTVIYERGADEIVTDLTEDGQRVVVARGGRGGVGNANARQAMPGQAGEQRHVRLELKLIADVGLVGFPNAGKSSLLRRLSAARPKVAAYPFTTRHPVLGVVQAPDGGSFVACDIPGLIEGASQGRGLGFEFLRHIERTRLLLHVVDLSAQAPSPLEAYRQLGNELAAYNPVLARRPQLVVANKLDLPEARAQLEGFRQAVSEPVLAMSTATGEGIPQLLQAVWEALARLPQAPASQLSRVDRAS